MMPPGLGSSLANGFSVTGSDGWSSLSVLFTAGSPHAFAGKFDPVGVMNEAVQDRIGVGGIGDDLVPAV
jgi:hypothetical protein